MTATGVPALAAAAAHDRLGAILARAAVDVDRAQAEASQAPEGSGTAARTGCGSMSSPWVRWPTSCSPGVRRRRTGPASAGTTPSMLVLATDDDELLRAAGLEQLDAEGYVEPVVAPSRPLHLLAQQLLALCLQHGRVGRQTRTGAPPCSNSAPAAAVSNASTWGPACMNGRR